MRSRISIVLATILLVIFTVTSALPAEDILRKGEKTPSVSPEGEPERTLPVPTTAEGQAVPPYAQPQAPAAAAFDIDWYSINGGGVIGAASTSWTLDATVGQSVAGFGSSPSYQLEIGFWYGADAAACGVALTGDVDVSSEIKLSDVIVLVNYVLKAGPEPLPCPAAGDVTCDGEVKLSDVIYLVNYVLKAGTPPCDVCTLFPGTWSCP